MPSGSVKILTQGQTLVVDLLGPAGASVSAWSDAALTSTLSLPATISSDTTIYVRAGNDLTLSIKKNDLEIASEVGTTRLFRPQDGQQLVISPTVNPGVEAHAQDFVTSAVATATFVALSGPTEHAPALGLYFPEVEGAVGDNTADDTAALQAALTASLTAAAGTVWLGAKTYRITAPLTAVNTTVDTVVRGPSVQGLGRGVSTVSCDFDNGAAFEVTGAATTAPGSLFQFMYGGGIQGVTITQATGRTGVRGIQSIGWWYAEVAHNRIYGLSSDALYFPLRADINVNPDYYASAGWNIHHNDLSLNQGKGINGAAGLGFTSANIDTNRITNNLGDGVWIAGHNMRVVNNAIVGNGQYDGITMAAASGLVIGYVTAVPNGVEIRGNEFQNNVTDHVRIFACNGFDISRNRMMSGVATVSAVTAVYPPVHIQLGVAASVQAVGGGEMRGNHHRSDITGSYPLSVYKPGHTSVKGLHIINATYGTNTSAMVKYDTFNSNHEAEIIELGDVMNLGQQSRYYLGRLRTGPHNVTGTAAVVPFDNEWIDYDNDNDTALGYLTPYAGPYEVTVALTISGLTAGNTVTLQVRGAGSVVKEFTFAAAGLTHETFVMPCGLLNFATGQRITVYASQNSGTDKAVRVGDAYNAFSVEGAR